MALPSKEAPISEGEKIKIVERPVTLEVTPEEHMEPLVGETVSLPGPILDDTGQIVMDNTAPQQVVVKLPLTGAQMDQALHLKIIYSFRWLAEWMKRLLKIFGSKFVYKVSTGE